MVEWIEVLSDAVKIGLGAVISGATSFLILWKTHSHEIDVLKSQHQKEILDNRVESAIKFASLAHTLTYQHIHSQCSFDSEEYKNFLHLYNAIMLTASFDFQNSSTQLFNSVNSYIGMNKQCTTQQGDNLILSMRQDVNISLVRFHKDASIELKPT